MELRKEIKVDKKVFEIADKLGKEEILCQLSEECAELIQSCLKYRRTTKGLTPKSEEEVKLSTHEGEEFIYVLEGEIEILYGKDKYELKAGDSIYYESIVAHHLHSHGSEKAKILAVIYTPA